MLFTNQIAGFFKLYFLQKYSRYNVNFLHIVRCPKLNNVIFVGFGQACLGMLNLLQSKCHYLWERLSYFVYLLHAVTHLWKLQCYHAILFGYGPGPECPKFSKIINHQYLWKGISDFVDILYVVISSCYFIFHFRYPLKLQKYAILCWHCQA